MKRFGTYSPALPNFLVCSIIGAFLCPWLIEILFWFSVLITIVFLAILVQFSGINGVLYYTPQILEQAGVGVLLSNLGLSSTSSSLLISAVTTLLMLPCIAVAMRLMDISGRR